jgi:hypothetical protein
MQTTISNATDSLTAVRFAIAGGRFRVRLTEDNGPGRRWGDVLDDNGSVIGSAHDSIYGGRGFAVQTRPFGGFVSTDQIDFVDQPDACPPGWDAIEPTASNEPHEDVPARFELMYGNGGHGGHGGPYHGIESARDGARRFLAGCRSESVVYIVPCDSRPLDSRNAIETVRRTEPDDAVPNLDDAGLDPAELRSLAESLPDAIPDPIRAQLHRYAMLRADAIEQRLAGRIQQSLRIGHQLDRLYREVPEAYRW